MILVAFTYLGADVKVELIGNPDQSNEVHQTLNKRIGKDTILLDRGGEKYDDLYRYCMANNDFKSLYKDRGINFVFGENHAE